MCACVCLKVSPHTHTHICPQTPHLEGLALFINGSVIGARDGVCVGAQRAVALIITLSLLPSLCLAVPASLITPKERWIAWGHTHLPRREGKVDQVIMASAPIMPCSSPQR